MEIFMYLYVICNEFIFFFVGSILKMLFWFRMELMILI